MYERAAWQPLWLVDASPSRQAFQVVDYLTDVESRGLRPTDYDADALRAMVVAGGTWRTSSSAMARADVAISRSLLRLLTHLRTGRVDPAVVGFDMPNADDGIALAKLAVDVSRASDVPAMIATAEPPYDDYRALVRALARYRELAADSTVRLPPNVNRSIRPGDHYDGVPELRRLLTVLGDLAPATADASATVGTEQYAGELLDAVVAFQRRHGLEPDGIIGKSTMAQLRVPLAQRVRQIGLALERWRWLPHVPPERFVLVNIPAFLLYAFERESVEWKALAMKVIVGQARGRHHTPIFAGAMREVVFRPYWDVPPRIARNELLPIIRRQPNYMEREGLEIVRGTDENAMLYPATAENLAKVAAGTLRLRQRPGEKNAVGLIKLVFPNRYNVYLHGTPEQHLFTAARRDFSHGCIRVESPSLLAEFVLSDGEAWSRSAIDSAARGATTLRVNVVRPARVFVYYLTASADDKGIPRFYPDVYGHDAVLEKALGMMEASPPTRMTGR
jgi:murein L,D-transpeptidase YcbB/YkuD